MFRRNLQAREVRVLNRLSALNDDISDTQNKIVKTMADDLTGSGDLIKRQDQLIAVSDYLADKRYELSAICSDIDNVINEIMLEEDY
ncbi:hypothetical protein H5993_05220 [Lactobacillus alvi]|uniref:Phosphate transport system regulatory protein PhoU n=1 Tax=Limosilactobacillus alvi TaxID=990412 RepID=A0ABS2EP12_9LACO|nr:hypothetical protein [Limosilactobacillus alvi]MBM6754158.1 hypothetical protein [Limosilactobacillus alvi]